MKKKKSIIDKLRKQLKIEEKNKPVNKIKTKEEIAEEEEEKKIPLGIITYQPF